MKVYLVGVCLFVSDTVRVRQIQVGSHSRKSCLTLRYSRTRKAILHYTSVVIQTFVISMARRMLTEAERWQIIGMKTGGMSPRAIDVAMNVSHFVVIRLVAKFRKTGDTKDRPRSGRPRKTTAKDDRTLVFHARRNPHSHSGILRRRWGLRYRVSLSTVRRRLHERGIRAYRPIKRPLLSRQHMRARRNWCFIRQHWNIRTWRRVHWSDDSRFMLHVTDGRARVWRERRTAYLQGNIQPTVAFGGGSAMIWGCVSYDLKMDLISVQGTLNGQQYQNVVLNGAVVPHVDNHALATRPIFMDDNARPHRARAVIDFLNNNAIATLPWPAKSPDLNPIEHIWDQLGRQVRARDLPVQTLRELAAALHEEWRRIPMIRI